MTISYNRIFNVMTKMKDGGGIYVNGYTNDKWTNVMSHNWVDHDMHVFAVYCAMPDFPDLVVYPIVVHVALLYGHLS